MYLFWYVKNFPTSMSNASQVRQLCKQLCGKKGEDLPFVDAEYLRPVSSLSERQMWHEATSSTSSVLKESQQTSQPSD